MVSIMKIVVAEDLVLEVAEIHDNNINIEIDLII